MDKIKLTTREALSLIDNHLIDIGARLSVIRTNYEKYDVDLHDKFLETILDLIVDAKMITLSNYHIHNAEINRKLKSKIVPVNFLKRVK